MNNQPLNPMMFVGTGSDVGKSILNAAFCRIFKEDGYAPAPFKAQNMSLNSFATPEGLEIGRAQAMQAEACGIDCHVDMNPVLLKPTSDLVSQVVIGGKPVGNQSAAGYFLDTDRHQLFQLVLDAFQRLEQKYNPVVMEGAGSISEINLWSRDIVNMRMAKAACASVFLVADIDKGGVFASVYGSLLLLPEDERRLIKGVFINKFRGDISLFQEGKKKLEELTGIPVVGIIPWFYDIFPEDEDSVVLTQKQQQSISQKINIAVVWLPHLSNFTDFNALERVEGVHLFYARHPSELENADIIILPGTKNTMGDLHQLRLSGMAKAILNAHQNNKTVIGICGGYQMMGTEIHDPFHIEDGLTSLPGLGILPVTTILSNEKITRQRSFRFLDHEELCAGYEIHMGETSCKDYRPINHFSGEETDGYMLNPFTWGTYLHGIFDNPVVVKHLLKHAGKQLASESLKDYKTFKEEQYQKLAAFVRKHSDIAYIYQILKDAARTRK